MAGRLIGARFTNRESSFCLFETFEWAVVEKGSVIISGPNSGGLEIVVRECTIGYMHIMLLVSRVHNHNVQYTRAPQSLDHLSFVPEI